MRYVSAMTDPDVHAEIMNDLSGLSVGSAFIMHSLQLTKRILKACDDAARNAYDQVTASGLAAGVECITLDIGTAVGYDSLCPTADLPENSIVCQVYRYFDTPREAIVMACIASPSQIKKTSLVTFFCGPDRRKTGDYRIFSIHPGQKRQAFPNRYQPEAVRRDNQHYWDRHVFMATPNQIIAVKTMMKERMRNLEPEARDRAYHMVRQMEASLHRWYGTWETMAKRSHEDYRSLMSGIQSSGEYAMGHDGTVYYFTVAPNIPFPNLDNPASFEDRLTNPLRPSVLAPDGTEIYYLEGKRHRIGAPALYQPHEDGGWIELWYDHGVISRNPEEGPAKIVYNPQGEIVQEVAILNGMEVEESTLGDAAPAVRALQECVADIMQRLKWYEDSVDFQMLRGQMDFAMNRHKQPIEKIVREMSKNGEQVSLRWDFDRILEQDAYNKTNYEELVTAVQNLGIKITEAAQAMRFVRGNPVIVNAIWGKIQKNMNRIVERGFWVPAPEQGKTIVDDFIKVREDSKRYFQSLDDLNKTFSATGK